MLRQSVWAQGTWRRRKADPPSVIFCPLAACLSLPINLRTAGVGKPDVCTVKTSVSKGKISCYFLKIKFFLRVLQIRLLHNLLRLLKKYRKTNIKLPLMSDKSWPGLSLHSHGQNKYFKNPPCTCSAMPFLHHAHSCINFLKIQLEINKLKDD